jgi:hypothetical protein
MRLAIMCILCALSLACVGESVASPGPPGVAPTLEPGQTQMRHPGGGPCGVYNGKNGLPFVGLVGMLFPH